MYLFNAKIENPEKLEKMLVGRAHVVDMLMDAQLAHTTGGMPPQFLVVGPRGSGKTHILRIIYDRLSKNADFMATHEIAYMVEDETGIGSYFDLLQRIFEALKRWSNDEQRIRFIADQVETLKEIHSNLWTKSAEGILLNILKDKSLVILIENFDSILKGIDKKNEVIELAKLRDFIQQHNQLSFIATSQSLINRLSDDQNPLYGFFNVIQLKRLTLEESFEYVKKIALSENNDELVQFLGTHDGKGHLEAIHQFTKGNHRLLLVFFDFLKAEFRSNLSDVFLKSIDELKPYYESFLRTLAPQQQKIVQYLCLQRNPQKGADISRNCFLDKNTVSKQLSELQLLGYVSAVNEKGRNKYYEINEPLLRMCIEINEDRNGIIKLFVNFLGQLYTAEQLKEKYLHYSYLERFQPEPIRKLYQSEAKIYEMVRSQFLNSWKLNEEEENKLNMCCEPEEVEGLIQDMLYSKDDGIPSLKQIEELLLKSDSREVLIASIQELLITKPNDSQLYSILGNLLEMQGKSKIAIENFKEAIRVNDRDEDSWYYLGVSYINLKDYKNAIFANKKAIEINSNNEKAWNNLGVSYLEIKSYKKALVSFQKAIEINPKGEMLWNNLGYVFNDIREYENAIEAYKKAIEININNKTSWYSLGNLYSDIFEYDKAIESYIKALEIAPKEENIWFNLGVAYDKIKKHSYASEAYLNSIKNKPHWWRAWNNLGASYFFQRNYNKAKETYLKGIEYINDDEIESFCIYYSNLIEVQFALKEITEALFSIETLFSKPERLEFITKLEDALVLICKENSEDAVKEVFKKLIQICEANGANEKLAALLSNVVFRILREYQEIKPFRIDLLQHILEELFNDKPEFTYPLRYFNIGIKYFLKDEKEAIYEMSQEERMIFEKFTSTESKN